jgi:hypothetical protein
MTPLRAFNPDQFAVSGGHRKMSRFACGMGNLGLARSRPAMHASISDRSFREIR